MSVEEVLLAAGEQVGHNKLYQHNHLSELKVFAGERRCLLGRNVMKSW